MYSIYNLIQVNYNIIFSFFQSVVNYNAETKSWSTLLNVLKETPVITDEIKDAFTKLSTETISANQDWEDLAKTVGYTDKTFIKFLKDKNYPEKTLGNFEKYIGKTKFSIDKLIGSLTSLATNIFITVFITELIGLFIELTKVSDKLKNSAKELGEEFSKTQSDIEGYKDKISELYKTINNHSSSIAEVTDARNELLDVQAEMIDKFGDEAYVINLTTEAINGQVDALDKLSKKKWQETVNAFNFYEGKTWKEKLANNTANLFGGYANNFERMIGEMENASISFTLDNNGSESYKEFSKLVKDIYDADIFSLDNHGTEEFTFTGDLDLVYDKLLKIQELADEFNLDKSLKNELTSVTNETKNSLDAYEDLYNQHILFDEIFEDENLTKSFDLINDAYRKYKEAFSSNDTKAIEAAKQFFANTVTQATNGLTNQGVIDYFRNMYPDLQAEVSQWQFEIDFKANLDIENKTKTALSAFSTSDDILKYDADTATEEQRQAYEQLEALTVEYGFATMEEFVSFLEEMGLVYSRAYQELVRQYGAENVKTLFDNGDIEIAADIVTNVVETKKNVQQDLNKVEEDLSIDVPVTPKLDTSMLSEDTDTSVPLLNTSMFDKDTVDVKLPKLNTSALTDEPVEITPEINQDEIIAQLKELQEGGNVNLLLRPQIDTSILRDAGWEEIGEGIATVYSSTFSNEDGTKAINFTPIIIDPVTGEYIGVMSPDKLQSYAEEVIAGTRKDDLNLQIGTVFRGKDAIEDAAAAGEKISSLHGDLYIDNDLILSWGELQRKIEEAKKAAESFSTPSFEEVVTGVKKLEEGFDQLDTIYADLLNGEDFDYGNFLDNESFKNTFGDLTNVTEEYKDAYDNFIQELSNSNGKLTEDVQSAFNKLASAYITHETALDKVTESTKQATMAQLEQMGVANAQQVVEERIIANTQAQAIQEQYLAETVNILLNQSWAQIQAYLDEAGAAEVATQVMAKLKLEQMDLSNNRLDLSSNISEILSLAKAAGIAGAELSMMTEMQYAQDMYESSKSSYWADRYNALSGELQGRIQDAIDRVEINFSPVKYEGGINSLAAAQKNLEDATKSATDALEKEKQALEDLKSEYDELYDAIQWFYDKQIDKIDKKIDALNDENEALEKQQKNMDKILAAIESNYDAEIKLIQDKIDALKDENDEEERALALEEAKRKLQEAKSRKTLMV